MSFWRNSRSEISQDYTESWVASLNKDVQLSFKEMKNVIFVFCLKPMSYEKLQLQKSE